MNILTRLFEWFDGILPVQCVYCNRVFAKKNAKYVQTQLSATVILCPSCHKQMYNPFSDE